MSLQPYREIFRAKGVFPLFAMVMLARLPITALGMVMTLHVVLGLRHGYTAAGFAGTAVTLGVAIGSPLMGRVLDSRGLRVMVTITTIVEGGFWLSGWALPYSALLPAAFVSGLLAFPIMSLGRQALTALVPVHRRRTMLSLDSISVELTYAIGPALGVLLCTNVSTNLAMIVVGALMIVTGLMFAVVNPPVRGDSEQDGAEAAVPRREWLGPRMLALLALEAATMFTLCGAELAMVATLRASGQVSVTGQVVAIACLASASGGIIYGGMKRGWSPFILFGILAVFTIPVGLVGNSWILLAIAWIPSNLACAPAVAALNERVMDLAPVRARGEAMGLASSANTLGLAIGAPLTGVVIDNAGPVLAFVAVGCIGLLIAGIGAVLRLTVRKPALTVG